MLRNQRKEGIRIVKEINYQKIPFVFREKYKKNQTNGIIPIGESNSFFIPVKIF